MQEKCVLVTGGSGFVGRGLVRALVADGYAVRLLTRTLSSDSSVDVRYIPDFNDKTALRAAMAGVNVVCHLAALAHVIGARLADHEVQMEYVNVELSCRIAEIAFECGVMRFIFVSSIGAVSNHSQPGKAINESSKCTPVSAYGRSKLCAEIRLQEICHRYRAELVIVRPPLVHGPDAPGNLGRLARWIRQGVPMPFASVKNRRSLIHVDNLSRALCLCVMHPLAAGQIFHVRDLVDYSTPDILRSVAKSHGLKLRLFHCPIPILKVMMYVAGQREAFEQLTGWLQVDDTHIRETLQFVPLSTHE